VPLAAGTTDDVKKVILLEQDDATKTTSITSDKIFARLEDKVHIKAVIIIIFYTSKIRPLLMVAVT
jgi:hypothetical protein